MSSEGENDVVAPWPISSKLSRVSITSRFKSQTFSRVHRLYSMSIYQQRALYSAVWCSMSLPSTFFLRLLVQHLNHHLYGSSLCNVSPVSLSNEPQPLPITVIPSILPFFSSLFLPSYSSPLLHLPLLLLLPWFFSFLLPLFSPPHLPPPLLILLFLFVLLLLLPILPFSLFLYLLLHLHCHSDTPPTTRLPPILLLYHLRRSINIHGCSRRAP